MTTITFLGHATFLIETSGKRLLIDPFLDGNPQASMSATDIEADVILLTHGHEDHVADAVSIAKRTGALVISNFEICQWLGGQGVENVHAMHIGGQFQFDFGSVKVTPALHGSMLPDGSNGGMPTGFLLKLDDSTIYVSGDTGLFSDMQLIGEAGIDLAVLPIGDNFTMGPEDATRAVQFLGAKQVIPSHFNTWPPIEQNPEDFAKMVADQTSAQAVVLKPGESHSV